MKFGFQSAVPKIRVLSLVRVGKGASQTILFEARESSCGERAQAGGFVASGME